VLFVLHKILSQKKNFPMPTRVVAVWSTSLDPPLDLLTARNRKLHARNDDNDAHKAIIIKNAASSSSRMRVIYHNWSAMKQRLHPQSVAEISHYSVLSGDRIPQCETSSGSRHKDTNQSL